MWKKNAWPNGGHCKNVGSKMSIALRPISAILDRSPGKVAHALQTALLSYSSSKLTRSIKKGRITFVLKGGRQIVHDSGHPGPDATIYLNSVKAISRMISGGYLGLAEGYLAEDWSTPSLRDVFDFGTANAGPLDTNLSGNLFVRALSALQHGRRRNSRDGSKRNIAEHYDLGNRFFEIWLDPSITYSSALFEGENITLAEAQAGKYQRILDKLDVQPHHHVIEIGCGWGGFAEYTARETGARVSAITISREQYDFARARMRKAGLSDLVDIQLRDYRDLTDQADRVVSIEMLEAVGEDYWPGYFNTVSQRLRRGGAAMIQVITVPDEEFEAYRTTVDFIQRYIFPGGMLLCPEQMAQLSKGAGLTLDEQFLFGTDYARTLELWQAEFQRHWPTIQSLGFDERFKRMWEYYLDYTSAGFRSGATNVGQFLLRKP